MIQRVCVLILLVGAMCLVSSRCYPLYASRIAPSSPASDSTVLRPARIFILKTGSALVHTIQLFTDQMPEKPIRISNQSFVDIVSERDSIGFLQGRSFADSPYSEKARSRSPVYLIVKPGEEYYFKITSHNAGQPIDVVRVSGQEFWMYILVNELDNKGIQYRIDKAGQVVKLP